MKLRRKDITNKAESLNSSEIADLFGVRHDNPKLSIESLVDQGVITLPQNEETSFKDSIGKRQRTNVYVFTGEQGRSL